MNEDKLEAARATIEELLFALEAMLNLTLDEDDIAVSSRVTTARAVIARARAKEQDNEDQQSKVVSVRRVHQP